MRPVASFRATEERKGIPTIQEPVDKMEFRFRSSKNKQLPDEQWICGTNYNDHTGRQSPIENPKTLNAIITEKPRSTVAEHFAETKHSMDFDKTEFMASIRTYRPSNKTH
jgi:hypothetical protein